MYSQLADVKESLDISGTTYDARITEYIEVASDWIDKHCGYFGIDRPFRITGDTTRYYDRGFVDGRNLYTDAPFISVTSVTNGDGVALASSSYRLQPRNHPRYYRIQVKIEWQWLFNDADSEIAVVGKFGYSEVPPTPIAEACRHLAGWMHQRWQAGLNTSSATSELGTIGQVTDVPGHILTLLAPYRDARKTL